MSDSTPPDFDRLWDFDDPAASERRFRSLLDQLDETAPPGHREQILTQLARAVGLQRRFDSAHELLDAVAARETPWQEALANQPPIVTVRYLLERGRVLNSSGQSPEAVAPFQAAWELARTNGLDGLAVDAAHMMAIVSNTPSETLRWNEAAMRFAKASSDPSARKWLGSLENNIGWTCFEMGDYERALNHFEQALEARKESGKASDIRVARWCIAKTLRMLGRVEAAMEIQRDLLQSTSPTDKPDGYVFEELAECLLVLGRAEEARVHCARAYELLSEDSWLRANESPRLQRLKELAST